MLLPVGRLAVLRVVPRKDFLAAMSFVTLPGLIGPLVGPTLGGWLVADRLVALDLPDQPAARRRRRHRGAAADARSARAGGALRPARLRAARVRHGGGVAVARRAVRSAAASRRWCSSCSCSASRASSPTGCTPRARDRPLFPLALFKVHTFGVGLLGNLFSRVGSGGMPYLIPLLLQVALGYSPMQRRHDDDSRRRSPACSRSGSSSRSSTGSAIAACSSATRCWSDWRWRASRWCGPDAARGCMLGAVRGLRLRQLAAVHGDEHAGAARSGRRAGQQRQQPAVDGDDARDEPRRRRSPAACSARSAALAPRSAERSTRSRRSAGVSCASGLVTMTSAAIFAQLEPTHHIPEGKVQEPAAA